MYVTTNLAGHSITRAKRPILPLFRIRLGGWTDMEVNQISVVSTVVTGLLDQSRYDADLVLNPLKIVQNPWKNR